MHTSSNVDPIGVFLKYFRRRSTSPQSALNYERCLQRFELSLGKSLLEADEDDLDRLVSALESRTPETAPVKTSTLRTYIRILRSFYGFAHRYGMIQRNPMVIISNPKAIETIPHFLSAEKIRAVLGAPLPSRATGIRLRALLHMLYSCALRANEALSLDVDDVDLHRRVVLVRHGKGGKVRGIPLSESARDAVCCGLSAVQASPCRARRRCLWGVMANDWNTPRRGCRSNGPSRPLARRARPRIGCGTALRPTCCRAARTCDRPRSSWDIPKSRRPQIYTHVSPEEIRKLAPLLNVA
jgi:integrase